MPARSNLSNDLLAFMAQPRTLQECYDEFGHTQRVRSAVYNLVKRNEASNLNAEHGRSCSGLYVAVCAPPAKSRGPLTLDWTTGAHLFPAWMRVMRTPGTTQAGQ